MVRVAGNRARAANTRGFRAGRRAGEAEVDCLARRPKRVGAGAELIRERGRGFGDERVLLFKIGDKGWW